MEGTKMTELEQVARADLEYLVRLADWAAGQGFYQLPDGYAIVSEMNARLTEQADALALQVDELEGKYAIVSEMNARLTEALRAAEGREKAFIDALIWCSGSQDFNEGGQAREGWLKLCRPLIDAALKEQSHD